jgi:ligand-binding sensor domain-containing protein
MKQKAVIFFLLCLLTALHITAQTPQYQFTRIDVDQGLSNSQINCIFKDSKGFIWFGTMSGLNRYDGYSFRVFRNDLRDSSSLPDNYVERITEGPDGLLWIYARATTGHPGECIDGYCER